MKKYILATLIMMSFGGVAPMTANAATSIEIIEQENQQAVVSLVSDNVLRVANANGQMLYVYNVAGVRVQTIKVDGMDKYIELNLPKGCYIVKVGKTVRKISIK